MEMKKKYELMAIISSQITDHEIEKRLGGLRELLGDIGYEELWGMRPFAYRINKQEKGYYVVWNFMAETESIHELEKTLKLYPDLLRFLITSVPEEYKPITLKEIEAGLEALKKQKADKRSSGGRPMPGKPKPEKAEPAKKTASEPRAPKAAAQETPAAETEETKAKKTKTLDEKLKDILSDDDLGL